MEDFRNLIVIGASAGGLSAINELLKRLPAQMDAAVIVVLHVSRKSNGKIIADTFQRHTSLICAIAATGKTIKKGHLYVAPPNNQLMVKAGNLIVNQGTHENKYRPSIDVLFRSAAVHYGNRVVGIILTGMLEDGTSGMYAIKKCGGICIVQDPVDAQHSDMPQSVMNLVNVDYAELLADMPYILQEILHKPLPEPTQIPEELKIEANLTEQMMSDINQLKKIADHSDFACPECGGGLWKIKNDPIVRYRCHTGHVYTQQLLDDEQNGKIQESIWVSIRMLEERRNLLLLMCSQAQDAGRPDIAGSNQHRAHELNEHIVRLKDMLAKMATTNEG
jgi:two-component system, chemotaxis family, protein-glutamate methylesterase/glutaminase